MVSQRRTLCPGEAGSEPRHRGGPGDRSDGPDGGAPEPPRARRAGRRGRRSPGTYGGAAHHRSHRWHAQLRARHSGVRDHAGDRGRRRGGGGGPGHQSPWRALDLRDQPRDLQRGDASGHIGYAHRFPKGCSMTGWNRQGVLALALAGAAVAGLAIATPAPPPDIIVYKTSTCGCCKKWVEHLEAAGFRVTVHDTVDMAGVAAHYGVPRRLSTCHTALVQGYVVEGHVPVDVIERLLKEGPEIAGVAVPGMPPGSPGMESETPVHYQIVTFDKSGGTAVYGVR